MRGPKLLPCDTPPWTYLNLEVKVLIFTIWVLLDKYDLMRDNAYPHIP